MKLKIVILLFLSITLIFLFHGLFINKMPTAQIVLNKNIDKKNAVNIVFTTDKKYVNYLKVAVLSAVMNKNVDSYYNIYVLGVDLGKKDIENIKNIEKQKEIDNFKITVIPLKISMLNKKIKHRTYFHHVSKADYFKFFMPEIFSSLDKILYLDCDILVLDDLSDLYNTNLENKYYGAVQRFNYDVDLREERFNIGVVLYNLDYCRKNNLTEKLLKTKNELNDSNSITQASFNKTVDTKFIVKLSPIYNNRTKTTREDFVKYDYIKNYSPFLNDIKTLEELDKKTIIVHFADFKKPWYNPDMKFGDKWWEVAHIINPDWKIEKKSIKDKSITAIYNFIRRK